MGIEVVLAGVAAGAALASGGLSAYGAHQTAEGQKAAGRYRAAVARNNAVLAEANAAEAEKRAKIAKENALREGFAGQERAFRQDVDAKRELGAVRAGQAASGLTGGSHSKTIGFLRELAAEDRENIRRAGDERSSAFRTQAQDFIRQGVDFENRARQLRSGAKADMAFTRFNANTTKLGGIAQGVASIGQAASSLIGAGVFDSASAGAVPTSAINSIQDPAMFAFRSPSVPLSFGSLS